MRPLLVVSCAAFGLFGPVAGQSAQDLIDAVLNPDPAMATYASYGSQIYLNATLYNQTLDIPLLYADLQASAKERLSAAAYDYAAGGAGRESTLAANWDAFEKAK
jgi:lactate 2-monooxygenase